MWFGLTSYRSEGRELSGACGQRMAISKQQEIRWGLKNGPCCGCCRGRIVPAEVAWVLQGRYKYYLTACEGPGWTLRSQPSLACFNASSCRFSSDSTELTFKWVSAARDDYSNGWIQMFLSDLKYISKMHEISSFRKQNTRVCKTVVAIHT